MCKLHKALHCLKYPTWFQRFSNFILRWFLQSIDDSSLFTFHHGTIHLVLLLYMDDIVLTGNDFVALWHFIDLLGHEFEIKDFGPLH